MRHCRNDLSAHSVFSTTSVAPPPSEQETSQFSTTGMGMAANHETVDPVVEADTFLAFGRDAQAEEILLEALKTDPQRQAIHLKLLDIYAARKKPPVRAGRPDCCPDRRHRWAGTRWPPWALPSIPDVLYASGLGGRPRLRLGHERRDHPARVVAEAQPAAAESRRRRACARFRSGYRNQ